MIVRLETTSEHIARDMREGRFPGQSAPQMVEEPETGDVRRIIVNATWKGCAHGGGWWVAKDADGREVLLVPDGFAPPQPRTLYLCEVPGGIPSIYATAFDATKAALAIPGATVSEWEEKL